LINLIKSLPPTLKYEPSTIVAEGDFVIGHGKILGFGQPRSWVAADVVRVENGVHCEQCDALQDEAIRAESRSGLAMFGEGFPRMTGRAFQRSRAD
jgi:hypothetical protein